MRVGIDYLPAVTHWPGVGRYARELVRALAPLRERPELALLDLGGEPRTIGEPWLGIEGHGRVTRVSRRTPRRAVNALHRVFGRGADRVLGGVDLFHRILPHYPPVSDAPQTMAVGELPPEGSEAEAELARVLGTLAGVLVASRFGADELVRRFDLPRERVHLVSLGCDHWRRELPEPPPRSGEPTLLVLGAVRPDRHHVTILAAFEELLAKREAARLVIVGGGTRTDRERFSSKLRFSPAHQAVEWIDEPDERALPRLVAEAWVLVHLSQGELTAVTPLEAFSFGTAVVTNPGGPFEEALGDEARTFDTGRGGRPDPSRLAEEIRAALATATDPDAHGRRVRVAEPFSWTASARRTVDAWSRVLA